MEVNPIKASDQVMVRTKSRSGIDISYGQVVSIQGAKALTYFPVSRTRREIPVADLELVSSRKPGVSSVSYVAGQRVGFKPYKK